MTLFSVIDVDLHVTEKTKNAEYNDDVDEKNYTVERPHKVNLSAYQSNMTRDRSPCGKKETNKERGRGLKRNSQIQASRDCQGHRMSISSHINTSVGPGRPPITS
jgi:hypothetical protein